MSDLLCTPIRYDNDWKTFTQLKHDLVVGSFVHAPYLIDKGWVCVLLAKAAPTPQLPSTRIPLIDGTGNSPDVIRRVVYFVLKNWSEGNRVAVLCRSGANRAPAIAAGSLFAARRATSVYGAIEWMRGKRREVGHYGGTASEVEFAVHDMLDVTVKEEPKEIVIVKDEATMGERTLIHFTHGLGDSVQLSCIFQHLKKYCPDWELYLQALRGKHSSGKGHCLRVWHDQEASPDHGWFTRYYRLRWWENYNGYHDCPNSKVTNCLREVFGLQPDPSLLKYKLHWDDEDINAATKFLNSCGTTITSKGKHNAVLIHYQGNTSPQKKNLDHSTVAPLCERIIEAGYIPIILDWDKRSPLPDGKRIFNPRVEPNDMWGGFGSGDSCRIAALVHLSTLFIGIDSGPQKCAGATETPCIGVWSGHSPVQFFDLCDNFVHLVSERWWEVPPCQNKGVAHYFENHYKFRTYRDVTKELIKLTMEVLEAGEVRGENKLIGFHYIPGKADQDWVVIDDIYLNDAYRTCLIPKRNGPEVVVDIGSHIGTFARLWHERNPSARIVCVEVNDDCVETLTKNVASFAQIIHAACVTSSDPLYLLNAVRGSTEVGSTGGSRVVSREVWEAEQDAQYRKDHQEVKKITLQEIMDQCGLDHIDVLKLDCEGSEFSILENAPLDRIGFIVGEYHSWSRFQKLLIDKFQNWDFGHMSQNGDMGNFHLRNRNPPCQ